MAVLVKKVLYHRKKKELMVIKNLISTTRCDFVHNKNKDKSVPFSHWPWVSKCSTRTKRTNLILQRHRCDVWQYRAFGFAITLCEKCYLLCPFADGSFPAYISNTAKQTCAYAAVAYTNQSKPPGIATVDRYGLAFPFRLFAFGRRKQIIKKDGLGG